MPLSPSGGGRLMDVHVQDAFCSPFRVWSATLPTLQSWGQIVEFCRRAISKNGDC